MEKTRAFSSVQVNLPKNIADDIISWGDECIPDEEIFLDMENYHYGREDEIHITLLYGIHTGQSQQVEKVLKNVKSFSIELGRTNIFKNSGEFDVVMVNVLGNKIYEFNELLRDKLSYTNKFPKYQPHVTIAYVKKGNGWKYGGKNIFEGTKINIDQVFFSSKNGEKTNIKLNA